MGPHPLSLDVVVGLVTGSRVFQSSIAEADQTLLVAVLSVLFVIFVSAIVERIDSHGSENSFPADHEGMCKTSGSVRFGGMGRNVRSLISTGRGAEGYFL
jgi:hypothetical protein